MTSERKFDREQRRGADPDAREMMEMMKTMMSQCTELMAHRASPCCGTREKEDATVSQPISDA